MTNAKKEVGMKIDEIIARMNHAIAVETGIENAVHTIVMTHEAFDRTVIELFRTTENLYRYRPSSLNDLEIHGVKILARERDVK